MDKNENHKKKNHHQGMGQNIYHKNFFICILSFSNGGQHCKTTNVEEVVEIIIDIDQVEPMSKVVQNYFQLNIHDFQFGYSFNPTPSIIEVKYTIKVFPSNQTPSTQDALSQPHFEANVRRRLTLPKVGIGSPPGLPQLQSLTIEGKTPCLEVFFIPLERS
jgi:hypothetical protein